HEADALPRRRDHGAYAAAGGAPHHVDRLDLALGVHAHAAHLRLAVRHVLEDLGRRRDRVAGVEAATGLERRLGDGVAAFHEDAFHTAATPPRSTSTTTRFMALPPRRGRPRSSR